MRQFFIVGVAVCCARRRRLPKSKFPEQPSVASPIPCTWFR